MNNKKSKPKRRGKSEGTICLRDDGRWVGALSLGSANGRRQRRWFYGDSEAAVCDMLLKARTDHAAGLPMAVSRQTVEQFLTTWLRDTVKPSVRPLTFEQFAQHVRLYLVPAFGKTRLHKLHAPAIQRFVAERQASGLSPRTVQISLSVLSLALDKALKWNLIGRNPVEAVTPPKVVHNPIKTFTQEQARAFLTAAKGRPYHAAFALALLCGLRRGEILALRWEGVDLAAATLKVTHALERIGGRLEFVEPKSRESRRTLPLSEPIVRMLRAHRARQAELRLLLAQEFEDHGLLFPNGVGRPLEPRRINRLFKDALKRAGLPPTLRLHDCRHFAATTMIADGTDVRTVADLLGHADSSLTLRTYAHAVPEAARRAVDRMGALVEES